MKRFLSVILCLALVLAFVPAMAADAVTVYVNGKAIEGAEAKIISDRTYLPVRAVSEALGLEVDWIQDTLSVILGDAPESTEKGGGVSIYLNGALLENTEAELIDDRTYVPVRAISEALGLDVEWDNSTRSVFITESESYSGGYYRIRHVLTGCYLSVENANKENGAKIVVAADSSNDNQVWGFSSLGDGYYKVCNKNTGKSVDVSSSSVEVGKEVSQYTANGGYNQQLKAVSNGDGTVTFVFRHSDLVLTATERYVTQEEASSEDSQKFTLEYVGATPMGQLLDSPGYNALGEDKEKFYNYVFSDLPFCTSIYNQVENELIAKDYFSLSESEQADVLRGCMEFVPYRLVYTGEVYPDTESAEYEIVKKSYVESYDVWRGTMLPVWTYDVKMDGASDGTPHEWTMISTVEDSSVVYDAIDALARFPYAMRKFIKRLIYRTDSANNYNGGGDTIWIRLTFIPSQNAIAQSLAHELGHVLDTNLTTDSGAWDRAIASDKLPISGYGNNNRTEDLAEFSRLYHMIKHNPEDLKTLEKVYPARFAAYATLLYMADSDYYADYKSYYEASMSFDDDDKEPTYVEIGIPGTDLVLTCDDASERGSNLRFAKKTGDDSQIFRLRETDGKKTIFSIASALCVNVPGESKDSGTNLILYNGGKGTNETTEMIQNDDGTYSFKFTHSGLYLGSESQEEGALAIQTDTAAKLEVFTVEIGA